MTFLQLAIISLALAAQAAETATSERRVEFREPRVTGYLIEPPAATLRQLNAGPPWTSARLDDGSTNRVALGSRVVLQIDSAQDLARLLAGRPLQLARQVSSNFFILQAESSSAAIDEAARLARESGVTASYPVMRRALKLHRPYARKPNDPYFGEQWHLENRGPKGEPLGIDLNVRAAWPVTRGQGVLVAIGDDGVDFNHSDLATPTAGAPHFIFTKAAPAAGGSRCPTNATPALASGRSPTRRCSSTEFQSPTPTTTASRTVGSGAPLVRSLTGPSSVPA